MGQTPCPQGSVRAGMAPQLAPLLPLAAMRKPELNVYMAYNRIIRV